MMKDNMEARKEAGKEEEEAGEEQKEQKGVSNNNLVKNISRTHVQPFFFERMVNYVILFLKL